MTKSGITILTDAHGTCVAVGLDTLSVNNSLSPILKMDIQLKINQLTINRLILESIYYFTSSIFNVGFIISMQDIRL